MNPQCSEQLTRQERETGADVRLSLRLYKKCFADYQRFCKKVQPGNMRVQECLEDHVDESGFSTDCKEELELMIAKVGRACV